MNTNKTATDSNPQLEQLLDEAQALPPDALRAVMEVIQAKRQEAEANAERESFHASVVEQITRLFPEAAKATFALIPLTVEHGIEFKRTMKHRFYEQDYAEHVGTHTKTYNSTKNPEVSGEYKLNVAPGRTSSEKVFMELREPSGRVLAYPPVDTKNPVGRTEDGKPDANAERVECSSISSLLKDSTLGSSKSLHQVFGLQKKSLQSATDTASSNSSSAA